MYLTPFSVHFWTFWTSCKTTNHYFQWKYKLYVVPHPYLKVINHLARFKCVKNFAAKCHEMDHITFSDRAPTLVLTSLNYHTTLLLLIKRKWCTTKHFNAVDISVSRCLHAEKLVDASVSRCLHADNSVDASVRIRMRRTRLK